MITTIIGTGLIGGSMAIDLRKRGWCDHIIGVEPNPEHAKQALETGIVDEILPMAMAIEQSKLVILATPVDVAIELLPRIMDRVTCQVVMDVCSTKCGLSDSIRYHPNRCRYVATHPMAGTEFSGPMAAKADMFDRKVFVICDADQSDSQALSVVGEVSEVLNMKRVEMNSNSHDEHAAYVSHISHITSFALALTVLEKEKSEKHIFDLAGGGFDSTVRLAKSSASMWTPVFNQNANNILAVIDAYIQKMKEFRDAISSGEKGKIDELIKRSNAIGDILIDDKQ